METGLAAMRTQDRIAISDTSRKSFIFQTLEPGLTLWKKLSLASPFSFYIAPR